MSNSFELPNVTIALNEENVAWLLSQRTSPTDSLNAVISGLREEYASAKIPRCERTEIDKSAPKVALRQGKYVCMILDHHVYAITLYGLFGAVVDFMDDLLPEALEKLATMRPSNARMFIARERIQVHANTTYLGTWQTKSGWWISKNVSKDQTIGALKALCSAANITYGKDILFQPDKPA